MKSRFIILFVVLSFFIIPINSSADPEERQWHNAGMFNYSFSNSSMAEISFPPELEVDEDEREKTIPKDIILDLEICKLCLEILSIVCIGIYVFRLILKSTTKISADFSR